MPVTAMFDTAKDVDLSGLANRLPFGRIRVQIEAGAHRGASHDLRAAMVSVGSDIANDIVLFGDDLAPRHFSVHVTDPFFGKATVRATEGSIAIDNERILEPGESAGVRLPIQVSASDAVVEISPGMELDQFWTKTIGIGVLLVGLVIGMQLLSALTSPGMRDLTVRAPIDGIRNSIVMGQASNAAGHLAELRERLAAGGLTESIFLEETSTGAIVASGAISDEDTVRWRSVLQWHDGARGAPLLVNNVRKGEKAAALPQVRSIWMGDDPYVVLDSGRKAREGDTLQDGWQIEKITNASVILNRSGRRVSITY